MSVLKFFSMWTGYGIIVPAVILSLSTIVLYLEYIFQQDYKQYSWLDALIVGISSLIVSRLNEVIKRRYQKKSADTETVEKLISEDTFCFVGIEKWPKLMILLAIIGLLKKMTI